MATIRPNAEPAATTVADGDIFLIDGTTGVRALAASVVPIRDANTNASINNVIEGFASTATAAGTTTLTAASAANQFFTGTTTQTVQLPDVTTLALGHSFFFQNSSTGAVTIESSGGNTVKAIGPGAFAIVTCIAITGTTATSWQATYFADIVVSGKVLTLNNSLTLAGTDGTTMTFPGTSASVARTDAGQTFTGTQAFGALTATSINGNTITTGTGTLTLAAGKTLTGSNTLTFAGTDASTLNIGIGGTITGSSAAAVFYDNMPQNSKSAAYTTVLADAQKHILHPAADTTARTFTIDSNANVAYPLGTTITFINQNAAGTLTIAITSDTMRLAGAGTTGSRTLAANGVATAIKLTSTEWIISGVGLT